MGWLVFTPCMTFNTLCVESCLLSRKGDSSRAIDAAEQLTFFSAARMSAGCIGSFDIIGSAYRVDCAILDSLRVSLHPLRYISTIFSAFKAEFTNKSEICQIIIKKSVQKAAGSGYQKSENV